MGKRWLLPFGPEIDPGEPACLADRIGARLEARLEVRVRDVRRFEHGSIGGELPAVIDAANSAVFDAPQDEGSAAMPAMFVEHAQRAITGSEQNEVLVEQGEDRKSTRLNSSH